MRRVLFALLVAVMSSAPAWALTEPAARQLLGRTNFSADPASLKALLPLSQAQAVDRLVDAAAAARKATTPAPDWVGTPFELPRRLTQLSPEERKAAAKEGRWRPREMQPGRSDQPPREKLDEDQKKAAIREGAQRTMDMQTWWMREMLTTQTPLTERMTLFWHGHFTSSQQPVKIQQLMYQQNVTLRAHALGNYRELVHAIARDGAMLLYLNNQENRKGKPNENFARELLELFTLGEGNYTEADIKETARAFTGWQTTSPNGRFVQAEEQHDDGIKTVLGERGNFSGDDVIDIILKQPRAAEFIVGELWREFISPQPDAAAVQRLAASFRKDWELAPLLKALLKEPAMQSADNAGSLVKSPIDFVVGTVRALKLPLSPLNAVSATDSMGQNIFYPPNVKGWPSGDGWITSQWLLARRDFVQALAGDAKIGAPAGSDGGVKSLRKRADREMQRSSADLQRRFGEVAENLPVQDGDRQFLVLAAVQPPVEGAKPPDRLQTWLLDPVYNLK